MSSVHCAEIADASPRRVHSHAAMRRLVSSGFAAERYRRKGSGVIVGAPCEVWHRSLEERSTSRDRDHVAVCMCEQWERAWSLQQARWLGRGCHS